MSQRVDKDASETLCLHRSPTELQCEPSKFILRTALISPTMQSSGLE
jgi:hypothetical protein